MEAFKPLDVYPCTTDEEAWHPGVSMEALFGHICSGSNFVHDQEMLALEDGRAASRVRKRSAEEAEFMADGVTASQTTEGSEGFSDPEATLVDTDSDAVHRQLLNGLQEGIDQSNERRRVHPSLSTEQGESPPRWSTNTLHERKVGAIKDLFNRGEAQIEVIELSGDSSQISSDEAPDESAELDAEHTETQITLADSEFESQEHGTPNERDGQGKASTERDRIRKRKDAYKAAQGLQYRWNDFSPMSSGNAHTEEEVEL